MENKDKNKNKNTRKSGSGCRTVEKNLTNKKHDEQKLYTIILEELVKYLAEFIPFFDEKMETIMSRPEKFHSKH